MEAIIVAPISVLTIYQWSFVADTGHVVEQNFTSSLAKTLVVKRQTDFPEAQTVTS